MNPTPKPLSHTAGLSVSSAHGERMRSCHGGNTKKGHSFSLLCACVLRNNSS